MMDAAMVEGGDERLAVLHMVASGKLSPQEAADLLAALEPAAPPSRLATGGAPDSGVMLRIECEDGAMECEFVVPLEEAANIREMLPHGVGDHLPERLLEQLPRLARWSKGDTLLRFEDGSFEFRVSRVDD